MPKSQAMGEGVPEEERTQKDTIETEKRSSPQTEDDILL